ncbi:MAG: tRNA pseudouridine(55) synthase TruB [Lachnospiraceae bacterium]|nr:tRNA pseudouridine(55) synthase TruB [Lachnospiraceae bacterium]
MISGSILIDKEKGFTSFDVVAKMRGILHERKIGHNGTLDPDATGLLQIFVGQGTKAIAILPEHDKTYEAEVTLGITTDTDDISGQVLSENKEAALNLTVEEIEAAFCVAKSRTQQIPPMYSAKKINGKKLYELAREGKTIERKPSLIKIYRLEILEIDLPRIRFLAHVSKGTYIRTICHDLGDILQTGACMSELRRTEIGTLSIDNAVTLSELEELVAKDQLEKVLIPLEEMFSFPKGISEPKGDRYLRNGNPIYTSEVDVLPESGTMDPEDPEEKIRMYFSTGEFCGLFRKKDNLWKPYKMFLS